MRYKNLILTLVFALFLVGGAFITNATAQRRVIVYRPVYTRPYLGWGWGFNRYYYDPFWSNMYETPYQRYQEERYYAQSNLRSKEKSLTKDREKYARDGYLTSKEREKLAKDQRKLAEAREKAARYSRYY